MQNTTGLILAIGIAILVVSLIIGLYVKRREMVFEGQVIDKDIIEMQDDNLPSSGSSTISIVANTSVRHEYKITVKTDVGKVVHYQISEGMYETIKIGDRVSKPKGTTQISIVSSSQADAVTTSTPNTAPPAPSESSGQQNLPPTPPSTPVA